jgi:methyl-accepting chemotaxis protein
MRLETKFALLTATAGTLPAVAGGIWALTRQGWRPDLGGTAVTVVTLVASALMARRAAARLAAPLAATYADLERGSRHVATASSQIASANTQIADGASMQAANLEEISASLTEMSGMVTANAEHAEEAGTTAVNTQQAAETGRTALYAMMESIGEIKDSTDKMSRIIRTIDEIAFQTNLLALNAAVEAARAGDAGRGFAVVADEVRGLAGRSAQAAQSTAELIHAAVTNADTGVSASEAFVATLEEIITGIDRLNDLSQQVAGATREQARGIEQINRGLAGLDQVVQNNAASSEQTAAGCQELNDEAEQLAVTVGRLGAWYD